MSNEWRWDASYSSTTRLRLGKPEQCVATLKQVAIALGLTFQQGEARCGIEQNGQWILGLDLQQREVISDWRNDALHEFLTSIQYQYPTLFAESKLLKLVRQTIEVKALQAGSGR